MIHLLVADDHPLILSSVRHVLERDGEFEIVAETARGDQVLRLAAQYSPDVVLLDLRLPGLDGLVCLDQLKRRFPETKVIVFSAADDETVIANVLKRGGDGYVIKSVNPDDLAGAIRQVVEGTVFHALGRGAVDEQRETGLTGRELAILKALGRGLSNKAIAGELWVTEQTVKFHLTNIYRKLGVANRTQAARYALAHGLSDPPTDILAAS